MSVETPQLQEIEKTIERHLALGQLGYAELLCAVHIPPDFRSTPSVQAISAEIQEKKSVLLSSENSLSPELFLSQKLQDEWVIREAVPKREGIFLDLAASDGFNLSNSFVLEKQYGWKGLCIEPNPIFFEKLTTLRNCSVSSTCIDETPGEVDFIFSGELGGIISPETDNSPEIRASVLNQAQKDNLILQIPTKTLATVLEEHNMPEVIDYFSFDVEGAETKILRSFPFDRYRFLSMTIERPTEELNGLLFSNGYLFVKNVFYDSFYIHESNPYIRTIRREPFQQVPKKDW